MQVYVHSAGKEDPELVEVSATAIVRELVSVQEADGTELLWIEEVEEPVELEITLETAGIRHRGHVHRGRCRKVAVKVRYNGTDSREFSPSTTVATVFKWATGKHGFDLTPEEQAKHSLALPGADHPLDPRVHIGSLVTAGGCEVLLDLVPKVRFEG